LAGDDSPDRAGIDNQDVVRDLHADGRVAVEYLNGPGIDNKI
jgi:hypothetical protein